MTPTIEGFPLIRVTDHGDPPLSEPNAIKISEDHYLVWDEYRHTVTYSTIDFRGDGHRDKVWVRAKPKEFAMYLAKRLHTGWGIELTPGRDTHSGWETA